MGVRLPVLEADVKRGPGWWLCRLCGMDGTGGYAALSAHLMASHWKVDAHGVWRTT